MDIFISNTVVEFGRSEKYFNKEAPKNMRSISDTKSAIVKILPIQLTSDFLPPDLETYIQSQKTISST